MAVADVRQACDCGVSGYDRQPHWLVVHLDNSHSWSFGDVYRPQATILWHLRRQVGPNGEWQAAYEVNWR